MWDLNPQTGLPIETHLRVSELWTGLPERVRPIFSKIETRKAMRFSDPFVTRLQQLVPGMMNPGNLQAFNHVIARLPSEAPIVEVGAFCGLSTNLIAYFKRVHRATNCLVTCDAWDYSFKGLTNEPLTPFAGLTGIDFGRYAKQIFEHNARLFSATDLPYAIEAFSDDFFEAWEQGEQRSDLFGRTLQLGGPIAFCFIDGNHDYEFVRSDFLQADRFLEDAGWILFDDSADIGGSPGPRRLMRELRRNRVFGDRYEIVMKNPHYLVRKNVGSTD